jgi:hypothetical protein
MRRSIHSNLCPAAIHQQARQALQSILPWQPYKQSVSVPVLLDLLLLMAASGASLYATVKRFFDFCHETAARAVKANLPSEEQLLKGLVDGLYNVLTLSRQDRRRSWYVAIDINNNCYYGQPTNATVGGPKKQGTKWYFAYATAVLLHKRRRYTVALYRQKPGQKPHEIVQILLEQIAAQGLKIASVALDSAFDSGDTLLLLQERQLAYVVPLRRKGQGNNARNRCFQGRHQQIRWTAWTTDKSRRPVRTRVLLWKGSRKTMAFAFQGHSSARAKNLYQHAEHQRRLYRRRFGIETSYRQKHQAQAKTTSKDPIYRLLLEGIAYLLRQLWVVLSEALARCQDLQSGAWVADLTLAKLMDWLTDALKHEHPEDCTIPLVS